MPAERTVPARTEASAEATVSVIDDDPGVCQSLSWLFTSMKLAVRLFGSVAAYQAVAPARPGCVVADVRLPGPSGIELLARLRAGTPPVPVIVITGHAEVPLAVRAMRAGAFDFFEKPVPHQALLERVQEAVRLDRANVAVWSDRGAARERVNRLSEREREVFELLVRGLANKQVAARLGLSIKTVEAHRARVCEKLERDHLGDLILLAFMAGVDCSRAS